MSGTRPNPKRRLDVRPSGRRSRKEGLAVSGNPAGEDEILRTGQEMPGMDGPPTEHGEEPTVGPRGAEHAPGRGRGAVAWGPGGETRGGWMPAGVLLTSGEALAALLVTGTCCLAAAALLAVAGGSEELPEPIAGHGFVSSLLFGLACGLYVSLRLRSRRLAWRKQLEGKR